MKGPKRRATVDTNTGSERNDLPFLVSQALDRSFFDGSNSTELDVQRAVSSQEHVRALNTQFASWIQRQLKEHPDELWEDGVRDYLSHASNVMENFSDVVKWLQEKENRGGFGYVEGSRNFPKAVIDSKTADNESDLVKTSFFQGNTCLTFATPFVMPAFTGSMVKPNSESTKLSPGSSVIASTTLNCMPDFRSKVTKSNTTGTFTGNSTKSCGAVMPNFGSEDTNTVPNLGSKDGDTNTSDIKAALFGIPKVKPECASNEEPTSKIGVIRAPQVNSAQSSTLSWSSGAPFTFGNKSLALVSTSKSNDQDDETEPEQSGSPSVKKVEEEGVTVVHEVKCKLYVKSTDPADKDSWKDKGMGNLSIKCREGAKRGSKECKPTIVVRNDVGRLLLNALIYSGIKTNLQKNSIVTIFHTSVDPGGNDGAPNGAVVARTFLIRTKTEEDRDKLAAMIQECAPSL